MKIAGKTTALLIAIILALSLGPASALAAENKPSVVTVSEEPFENIAPTLGTANSSSVPPAENKPSVVTVFEEPFENLAPTLGTTNSSPAPPVTRAVRNLGTSGSIGYNWTLPAGGTLYSADTFKTESEKFVVRALASPSATSITVSLYNSDGSLVGSQTVTVGTIFQTKVTFTNLSSANTYYVKLTNNDQHSATISGTFAAK